MKRILSALLVAIFASVAMSDNVRIGTMDIPLTFQGNPPTGPVFDFVTNEVCKYFHPAAGFLRISDHASMPAPINVRMKATLVWRSPVFHDNIRFFVESGQTNCVVSTEFVTNAVAIHAEWNERSVLAASAEQFLHSVATGSVTNLPTSALRTLMRTLTQDGTALVPASETDGTDEEVRESFSSLSEHAEFEPVCLMEMFRQPVGTNEAWMVPVRTCWMKGQGFESDIAPLPLVYFDNYWSFLF